MKSPVVFDAFVLDPNYSRPVEKISPAMMGVLDPLYYRYASPGESAAMLEGRLADMRADLRATMEGMIGALTHDNARGLIKIAARGDWLYFENQLAQVILELLWTARLLGDAPLERDAGCEATLVSLCRKTDSLAVLERVLAPADLKSQAVALIEVMQATLVHIHSRLGEFHVDTEGWFRWMTFECRHQEVTRTAPERTAAAADRIAASMLALPTCRGVCITGSFAEPAKHDGLNDLDLCCYGSDVPDAKARVEFLARLGSTRPPREDAFEYLNLDGVNTHMIFARVENQRKALARLRADGDQSACLHFQHPQFALSAYQLGRARILHDPEGVIRAMKEEVGTYPAVLGQRVRETWAVAWTAARRRFDDAVADGDRAYAWVAHRYAAEAALRLLRAERGSHANPIEPKWFHEEIGDWPECRALAPGGASGSLPEHFAALCALRQRLSAP